jgi:hypothetical protein
MVLKSISKSENLPGVQNVILLSMLKCDKDGPRKTKRPVRQLFFKAILRNEAAKIEDKTRTEG